MSDDTDTTRPACGAGATLLITMTPDGTATNVARSRIVLRCAMPLGHKVLTQIPTTPNSGMRPAGATPTLLPPRGRALHERDRRRIAKLGRRLG